MLGAWITCLDPEDNSITRAAFTQAYRLVIISLREADVIGHMFPSWLKIHCSLREAVRCFNKCTAFCCHSASGPQLADLILTNSSDLCERDGCAAAFVSSEQKKQQRKKKRPELWHMPRAIASELHLPEDSLRQQCKSRRWQLHLVTQEGNVKHMQHHAWPAKHSERLSLLRDELTHNAS